MVLSGGCCCGAVRYETTEHVFHATICHCATCRRSAGAPSVAWFSVHLSDFDIISGSLASYQSSLHVTRGFCAECGTQLTYQRDDCPSEIDITLCSLDDPEITRPDDHTFVDFRLSWMVPGDDLPQFPRTRAEGAVPLTGDRLEQRTRH